MVLDAHDLWTSTACTSRGLGPQDVSLFHTEKVEAPGGVISSSSLVFLLALQLP